jgi:hypothetical protein
MSFTVDEVKDAISRALVSRGPQKGMLKANPPPYKDGLARAAWFGLMMNANPYKVSPFALMGMTEREEEMFAIVSSTADRLDPRLVAMADRDRRALEAHGVW